MQIVISHRETIKPSSRTPPHLRKLKLSLLDQFSATGVCARLLLFYSAQGDSNRFENTNTSHLLRKSLADVLTKYYPLAGRFGNDQSIDCNDSGVDYVEARVRAPLVLDQLLSCPDAKELDKLHPPNPTGTGVLFAAQITIFDDCGGMAIGVCKSHAVSDASALAAFMQAWSTIARGGKIVSPKFGFAHIIPPRDIFADICDTATDTNISSANDKLSQTILKSVQELTSKRFVFSKTTLAALMASCANQSPSRVQVVCAAVFKCLISAVRSKSSKPILLSMPINWRQRMSPPVPQNHVGNLVSSSTVDLGDTDTFQGLVGLVRKITRKVDSEYIKNMLADEAILLFNSIQQEMRDYTRNESHYLEISSLCKFPHYEIDFGWGTPVWATLFYVHVENYVTLLSSKDEEEIEAWVTLTEDDMLKFESAMKGVLEHSHISARL